MKVRQGLLKFISPKVPVETRRDVASTLAAGGRSGTGVIESIEGLSPADSLTILFILSFDPDSVTSKDAASGFSSFDHKELKEALGLKLDPRLLKKLASLHASDQSILSLINDNPGADSSVKVLTMKKKEAPVIDKVPEPVAVVKESKEEQEVDNSELNIYQLIQTLNTAEKIKLGLTGGKPERTLLINDANKVVSSAVLKNPKISENEIIMVVNSKNASDDILRMVARNKNWMKNTGVKLGLIKNPKTPLPISLRLLDYIDKRELARIAKSKNVSSVLSSNALKKMQRMR